LIYTESNIKKDGIKAYKCLEKLLPDRNLSLPYNFAVFREPQEGWTIAGFDEVKEAELQLTESWPVGINSVKFEGGHIVASEKNVSVRINYFEKDCNLTLYIKSTIEMEEEEDFPKPRKGFELPYNFGIFEDCPRFWRVATQEEIQPYES
jgi:hypothetical protein